MARQYVLVPRESVERCGPGESADDLHPETLAHHARGSCQVLRRRATSGRHPEGNGSL